MDKGIEVHKVQKIIINALFEEMEEITEMMRKKIQMYMDLLGIQNN